MAMVQPHQVAREKGTGSRSAIEDEKTDVWESKDARSDTETTFWLQDINNLEVSRKRKQRLKQILRRQEGENPGESYQKNHTMRNVANRNEWQRRVVDTYTSEVELTPHQKRRTKHLVLDVLDINSFGWLSIEQVVLGVINVVAREDGRWIEDEYEFRNLMDIEDMNPSTMRTVRQMVRTRL